ncbi:Tail-anchored protein insertion receptor WRB [Phytophthora nicotianae]|uniref:Tail-anchored protein insertion receptor WRB n=1 Tax=Phytophthora nicotianae TaxID=4792 RepID=A0A0W8D8G6_PHYNI|nr:Tail-anchored protein insertion receptor WRB [Phytophthora nicotianae]
MIPRSYAGDGDGKWLLFAREEAVDTLVFTAVVTHTTNVVAQLEVDADALKQHSEELGLEMDVHAFKALLVPTISRKGVFQLSIVAQNAPQSLVDLLSSIHAKPPQPMLSEQQKADKGKKNIAATATVEVGDHNTSALGSQETKNVYMGSQNSDNGTIAAVNPMLLKRRHMPTGTTRRRGPKGAKIAKK